MNTPLQFVLLETEDFLPGSSQATATRPGNHRRIKAFDDILLCTHFLVRRHFHFEGLTSHRQDQRATVPCRLARSNQWRCLLRQPGHRAQHPETGPSRVRHLVLLGGSVLDDLSLLSAGRELGLRQHYPAFVTRTQLCIEQVLRVWAAIPGQVAKKLLLRHFPSAQLAFSSSQTHTLLPPPRSLLRGIPSSSLWQARKNCPLLHSLWSTG